MVDGPRITRRQLLTTAGLAAAGSLGLGADRFRAPRRADASVPAGAWATHKRDPGRSGAAPGVASPAAGLRVAWRARPDVGRFRGVRLAADGATLYTATGSDAVALDAATGRERWRVGWADGAPGLSEPQSVHAPPTLADGALFVPAGRSLYRVTTAGRTRWQYTTTDDAYSTLLAGTTAFLGAELRGPDGVIALDTATGLPRWRIPTAQPLAPLAYTDGVVIAVPTIGGLARGLDAGNGEELWRTRDLEQASPRGAFPAARDGTVYLGTGPLAAIEARSGTVRWTYDADAPLEPVVDGRRVCFTPGTSDRVLALDSGAGTRLWETTVPGVADLAIGGATLYAGTERGIVGLDVTTGRQRFRFVPEGAPRRETGPVPAAGRVYAGFQDGLYALEAP